MDKKHCILIVDDEPAVCALLKIRLQKEGFEVLTAATGREGLEIAIEKRPDLIILDIIMPDLDGTETSNYLKEDGRTSKIPVLFLTGLEKKEEDIGDHFIGGNIVFAKPYDGDELIARIREILGLQGPMKL